MLPRPTSLSQDLAACFGEPSAIGCTACEPRETALGDGLIGDINVAQVHAPGSEIDMLLKDVTRSPGKDENHQIALGLNRIVRLIIGRW